MGKQDGRIKELQNMLTQWSEDKKDPHETLLLSRIIRIGAFRIRSNTFRLTELKQ